MVSSPVSQQLRVKHGDGKLVRRKTKVAGAKSCQFKLHLHNSKCHVTSTARNWNMYTGVTVRKSSVIVKVINNRTSAFTVRQRNKPPLWTCLYICIFIFRIFCGISLYFVVTGFIMRRCPSVCRMSVCLSVPYGLVTREWDIIENSNLVETFLLSRTWQCYFMSKAIIKVTRPRQVQIQNGL